MFSKGHEKYDAIVSKFGGFWRYPKLLDFCYLVNPYFPPKEMIDKLQCEFPKLLSQYPSGEAVQNMNAERIFGVSENHILVGNGAAELINALGIFAKGKVAIGLPTFNEYVRCFRNAEIVSIDNSKWSYSHNIDYLKQIIGTVDYMCLVSPDNPSGDLLSKNDVLELCELAVKYKTILVIDESFIDFADKPHRYTLLDNEILDKNPNLVVIKSISKSYGVPALRLGVLASSNLDIIDNIKNLMQIWNINSVAEYYLQIYNLYKNNYENACDNIASERKRFFKALQSIKSIKVYPSNANFLMIDLGSQNSYEFAVTMLDKYNILIKDLSTKPYFYKKNFIRIAIRDKDDNNKLLSAFKDLIK